MSQVLLLNASLEPLDVIPGRKALSLILRGRVDAVCEDSIELRGQSTLFHIPTIIRLKQYINVPQKSVSWSRKAVLQRDNFRCGYCGFSQKSMTIDHIIPISRGGKNTWSNTICACQKCNQRKSNRTPHEANMKLLWEPKRPRVSYTILSGHVPGNWKIYLEHLAVLNKFNRGLTKP